MFTIFPEYSRSRVTKAGASVRDQVETEQDTAVIENWRASHNYVLNTFQATLRRHARDQNITVAQRLKRRNTIYDKLRRQPGMQLARMHDIAGCRLIFENLASLHLTRRKILSSRFKHKMRNREEDYDYIRRPKPNGYRGIHDVYEYASYDGTAKNWDGLLIELQYRTRHQHAWATAVEIIGSLTGQEAKFDRGDAEHQLFFSLASELLARKFEDLNASSPELTNKQLVDSLNELENNIGVLRLLESIHVSALQFKAARNLILHVVADGNLQVFGYSKTKPALEKYFELEESGLLDDVVFVRSDSNEGVRSAFRNYFSDAREFTSLMRQALEDLGAG